MIRMSVYTAALGVALVAGAAQAGTIAEFALHDHPAGDQAPPLYGLRLDNVIGHGLSVLSFANYDDGRLVVEDNGGSLSIHITATMFGGEVENDAFVNAQSYSVDFSYSVSVTGNDVDGWEVYGFSALNSGTITNLDTNDVYTMYGKGNDEDLVFAFLSDGFRIHGDSDTWVGRGWMTGNSDGSMSHNGAQDWLFTATQIPAPGALGLLGLGGLVASRRRR